MLVYLKKLISLSVFILGVGRGKKGKNKKTAKASKNSMLPEEEPVEMTSKSSKRGGRRGKDKEATKNSSADDHSAYSSSASTAPGADKDTGSDVIASLIAPFIAKQRLMELFLQSCPVAFTEVSDALFTLSSSSSSSSSDDNYEDDGTGTILPLFEAIYIQLHHFATKEYTLAAEQALLRTTQGTHDTRLKRELNRDQTFEEYWTSLQVSSKVLLSFEKDCTPDTPLYDHLFHIHSFLLATKCAPIATLLTEFCCWEHDVESPVVLSELKSSLSFEQRRQLQKDLPQVGLWGCGSEWLCVDFFC